MQVRSIFKVIKVIPVTNPPREYTYIYTQIFNGHVPHLYIYIYIPMCRYIPCIYKFFVVGTNTDHVTMNSRARFRGETFYRSGVDHRRMKTIFAGGTRPRPIDDHFQVVFESVSWSDHLKSVGLETNSSPITPSMYRKFSLAAEKIPVCLLAVSTSLENKESLMNFSINR